MTTRRFRFRQLEETDLPMMHQWLNEPGVVRWWEGDDVSWDGVVAQYGPDRPDQRTEHWIASLEGEPVGWICCWPVDDPQAADEVAPWLGLGVDTAAAGIDYLVAAPDRRGQGIGSAMIRSFTFQVVFGSHCTFTQAAASPYTANEASCRALAKAGFTFAGSVTYPDDDEGPCSLMVMAKPAT